MNKIFKRSVQNKHFALKAVILDTWNYFKFRENHEEILIQ